MLRSAGCLSGDAAAAAGDAGRLLEAGSKAVCGQKPKLDQQQYDRSRAPVYITGIW